MSRYERAAPKARPPPKRRKPGITLPVVLGCLAGAAAAVYARLARHAHGAHRHHPLQQSLARHAAERAEAADVLFAGCAPSAARAAICGVLGARREDGVLSSARVEG